MKKLIAATLAVLAVAGTAWAGARWTYPVSVNTTSRYAYGSLGSTRNSADSAAYINCALYATAGTAPMAYCNARDANSNYVSCSSTDPTIVAAATNVNGDSYLYFTWDTSYRCNYMVVENGSQHEPKR